MPPMDVSPFSPDNLYTAAYTEEDREKLQKILEQNFPASFAVIGIDGQVFVDKSRAVVDGSRHSDGSGLVSLLVNYSPDSVELLKSLLSIGVDPDQPNNDGNRPSHFCAYYASLPAAACIFMCRPDMAAQGQYDSPLEAANVTYEVSHSFES